MPVQRRSNLQASHCTPSLPSSLLSQGSNTWVNSFSQGGVGSTNNNYMTPRGEYISRPPCSRVMLQTGTLYPSMDKVTSGIYPLDCVEANPFGSWCCRSCLARPMSHIMTSAIGTLPRTTRPFNRPLQQPAITRLGGRGLWVPTRTSSLSFCG